ncbi:hypothetical protein TNCV_7501 [Trichonephila clavipes]|nr:hypothetical protein TNCV_7501 [Trichonephila clavipes]
MFSKFTGIIIAIAVLYPSLAFGGKECFWCNRETARNFVTCFTTKLKEHAQFGIRPDILDDMQLSILAASNAITKTPDELRMTIMNGALAGEISGLIVYQVGSLNQNADIMVGQAIKLAGECYTSVTGIQHSIFSDNLGRMIIDMLDDSAPNDDYDVEPSYDYIAKPNNNGPHFDYSYQAPPEGNQPLVPFNQQDSFLPENRGPLPVSEFSQPQYFQAARQSYPIVESAPSSGAFPRPLQLPSAQESFQYSPRQDIPREQAFQERPNQPLPIAPPPILENGLINRIIAQQNNGLIGNQRIPNEVLRNQRKSTQNVPFNRQTFAAENYQGYAANKPQRDPFYPEPNQSFPHRTRPNIYPDNQATQFNNGPNGNYNSGSDNEWVPDRLESYNAAVPQANRFDNLPQNYNSNSGISTVGNQPDAAQNSPGLLFQQRNRPVNNVPLNGDAQRLNQGFYNQPEDSASLSLSAPITNFDVKQTGEIPQYGQISEPQLAPQDIFSSTLSNDGERLQPNTEQQRFNPPPNNWFPLNNQNFPYSDDVPIRSQPSNSWFPNFNRNNPDSDEGSSSVQTQNESENSKSPKYSWFPLFNRNQPESDSESKQTQVLIESRSTKAPVIQKPSKVPTTRKPIKQPTTKASTLQKTTTSKMPKTTTAPKSRISPAKACAVEFGEEMFVKLLKGDEFYSIFDEDLTHDLAISVGSEVVKKAMQDHGLSKYANDAATNCAREISLLPSAASTQAYAEKMAKSVMTIFYRNRLLKGNCKEEGGNVAEKFLNVLKLVAPNSDSDTNDKIGQNNKPEDTSSNDAFKSSYDEETQPSSENTSADSKSSNTASTHKRLPPKLKLKSKIPSQQEKSDALSQSNATPSNLDLSSLQNPPTTLNDENTAVGITQKPNRSNLKPQKQQQEGRYSSRHIPIRPLPGNKNNALHTKNTDSEISTATTQETDQESPENNSPLGKNQPFALQKSRLLHRRPGLPDDSNDNVPQLIAPNPDKIENGADATATLDDETPENYPLLGNNNPSPIPGNRRYPLKKLENQVNNAPQSNDRLIPNNNDNAAEISDEGIPITNSPIRSTLPENKGFLFNRPWNINKNAPQSNDRLIPNDNDNSAATSDKGIPINNLPVRSNQPLPFPESKGIPLNNRPGNLNKNVPQINNGQNFNNNDHASANEENNAPNDTPSRQRGLFNFSLLKKLIGDSDNNNDDNPLSDNPSSFDNDNIDSTTAEVATSDGGNPVNNPVNRPFLPAGNRYALNRLGSLINNAFQPSDDLTPENANTATAPASDIGSSAKNPFTMPFLHLENRRHPFNNRLGNQDKNLLHPIDGLIPANNENGAIAIAISDGGSSTNEFQLGNNQPPILENQGFRLYNEPGYNNPNINNNDDAALEPTISSEGNSPNNSPLRNKRPVRFPLLKKLGRDSDNDNKPSQIDDALSSNDDDLATAVDDKTPVNDQFNRPYPLPGNRRYPFNKFGDQDTNAPQTNDDLVPDNDGAIAAGTALGGGSNPFNQPSPLPGYRRYPLNRPENQDSNTPESSSGLLPENDNTKAVAPNGGNPANNPFNQHLPLRGNRYPFNKFGDQDTNAPQTNDDIVLDNDGAIAAETALGSGNNPFNQPSPLPGYRRYPINRPKNQDSNVPESSSGLVTENDNTKAVAANGGNFANNPFNQHLPLRGNRYPFNKFGDQDTNAPQTNDDIVLDNDGAIAAETVLGSGNNPFNQPSPLPGYRRYPLNRPDNQDSNVPESISDLLPENDNTKAVAANGGNPANNPLKQHLPLRGNRYPFNKFGDQDTNAPQTNDDIVLDNDGAIAAETALGSGNNLFNQPSPLPGYRRYPLNRPENQDSNVPESSSGLVTENDNTKAAAANGGNPANNPFNRHLPLRGNRYPFNKFGDQDTNVPQTNDDIVPDNDGAAAEETALDRGNNPFNQPSPLPGYTRYPLKRPENQNTNVPESSSGLIPENDNTGAESAANGDNPTNNLFNRQSPLPGNRRYPFSRTGNQDNNGESSLNVPQSGGDLTPDNNEVTASTVLTSDGEDSVSESPLGNKQPNVFPGFKSPFSNNQKGNVAEANENAPQTKDGQNSDKNMYTTPAVEESDARNAANNNQSDNKNLAENKPVENDGSSNQPQPINAPKTAESGIEAPSQAPKEPNSRPENQSEETKNAEKPDSLGKHSKHKDKLGNDEKAASRSKDNSRTTNPGVSSTTPAPVQSESLTTDNGNGDKDSENSKSNSLLDTFSDSSVGKEVQFLMKSALESVSPDGFDYKKFTSAMTSVASDIKKEHPKWSSDVTLKKLYVSTIVALIQDMQNIATKPADYNMQPKPETQPSSNPGLYSSNNQQNVAAASANSESSSYTLPTNGQTDTVLAARLSEPASINNRPLDNYQNAEIVPAYTNSGPIEGNILPSSQNARPNNVGFNKNFQPVRNYNNGGGIAPFNNPQNARNGYANVLPSNDYEYDYNSGGGIATSNFAQNARNKYENVGFNSNRPLNSNYNSGEEAISTGYGRNVRFIQPSQNFNTNYNNGRVLPSGFVQNARNNYGVGGFNNY